MERMKKFVGVIFGITLFFGCNELDRLKNQPHSEEPEPIPVCAQLSFLPPGIKIFYASLPEGHRLLFRQQTHILEDLQDSPDFRQYGVYAPYYPEQGIVLIQELDPTDQEVKRWRIRVYPVPFANCGPEQSFVELTLD